jgi:hypothetical protein
VRTVYCLWTFSGSFRHGPFLHSVTSPIFSPLSAPTCIIYGRFTALFGRPLLYSPLGQSKLVGTYVHCLWQISGNVKPLPGSIWTRTATTCITYGRFSALFGRPFCIALSTNQILSAPTCISYGRFSALFCRFFCSIETSREPRRFTIAPSFEIVLTSQTIISKRAT